MNDYLCITPDVKLGQNVKLSKFINLYGCEIGDNTKIGAFVEIQKNAKVGKNCKISSHTFICEGVNHPCREDSCWRAARCFSSAGRISADRRPTARPAGAYRVCERGVNSR